jgi:hypothetical protein
MHIISMFGARALNRVSSGTGVVAYRERLRLAARELGFEDPFWVTQREIDAATAKRDELKAAGEDRPLTQDELKAISKEVTGI